VQSTDMLRPKMESPSLRALGRRTLVAALLWAWLGSANAAGCGESRAARGGPVALHIDSSIAQDNPSVGLETERSASDDSVRKADVLPKYASIIAVVKDSATVLAIAIAGLLFFRRRRHLPRALVAHTTQYHALTNDRGLLSIQVSVQNPGEGLLTVRRGVVKVFRILPLGERAAAGVREDAMPRRAGSSEFNWPVIWKCPVAFERGSCEIEPGEAEQLVFECLVDRRVMLIRVYSYLENQGKRGRRLGWTTSTTHSLGQAGDGG